MSEQRTTLYNAHRAAQDKYAYFLLAAAGTAIGFAITQTNGATLAWSETPLGLAVFSWGLSFLFGCLHLQHVTRMLYDNNELLEVQDGNNPTLGNHPDDIAAGASIIRASMVKENNRSAAYSKWQFKLLIAGACFYLAWHVLEMYNRIKLT